MAAIRLHTGKLKIVTPEFGLAMWRIKQGEIAGSKAQQKFAEKVRKVYLNPDVAPESYVMQLASGSQVVQPRLPYAD